MKSVNEELQSLGTSLCLWLGESGTVSDSDKCHLAGAFSPDLFQCQHVWKEFVYHERKISPRNSSNKMKQVLEKLTEETFRKGGVKWSRLQQVIKVCVGESNLEQTCLKHTLNTFQTSIPALILSNLLYLKQNTLTG